MKAATEERPPVLQQTISLWNDDGPALGRKQFSPARSPHQGRSRRAHAREDRRGLEREINQSVGVMANGPFAAHKAGMVVSGEQSPLTAESEI
jgi:hypothetical protein